MQTEKISAAHILELFNEVPGALRKLASERDMYKKQAEAYQRREHIDKIAKGMQGKGLSGGSSYDELVSHLETWADQGKLAMVEQAVDLAGPDMGEKIAQVYHEGFDDTSTGGSGADLVRYLLDGSGSR